MLHQCPVYALQRVSLIQRDVLLAGVISEMLVTEVKYPRNIDENYKTKFKKWT